MSTGFLSPPLFLLSSHSQSPALPTNFFMRYQHTKQRTAIDGEGSKGKWSFLTLFFLLVCVWFSCASSCAYWFCAYKRYAVRTAAARIASLLHSIHCMFVWKDVYCAFRSVLPNSFFDQTFFLLHWKSLRMIYKNMFLCTT